jgi:hypothetical protein
VIDVRGWESAKRLSGKDLEEKERRKYPLPTIFSKRYDSKRLKGWESANDVIP